MTLSVNPSAWVTSFDLLYRIGNEPVSDGREVFGVESPDGALTRSRNRPHELEGMAIPREGTGTAGGDAMPPQNPGDQPGACPTERIVEVEALYTLGRWENREGHRLADIRNLVALQPLQVRRR